MMPKSRNKGKLEQEKTLGCSVLVAYENSHDLNSILNHIGRDIEASGCVTDDFFDIFSRTRHDAVIIHAEAPVGLLSRIREKFGDVPVIVSSMYDIPEEDPLYERVANLGGAMEYVADLRSPKINDMLIPYARMKQSKKGE